MVTTIDVPIRIENPDVSASYVGNSFWTVASLGNYQDGHWEFVTAKDGIVYGKVRVPHDLSATPNAQAVLSFKAPATTGEVNITFSSFRTPSGSTYDGTFNDETQISQIVPGSGNLRFDILFPVTGTLKTVPQADDSIIVKIKHSGTTDSLAVNLHLMDAVILMDIA